MTPALGAKYFPKYWGTWFLSLKDVSVKKTNLCTFYYLGAAIEDLRKLSVGMTLFDVMRAGHRPTQWLLAFQAETLSVPMPNSQKAAGKLLDVLTGFLTAQPSDANRVLTQMEMVEIIRWRDEFEEQFERENQNIDVFTVLPKGIYNTRLLIEKPEEKFPADVRRVFTDQIVYDLKQAGRCLAFEIPTACALHICRATESMILLYYQAVAGKPWAFTQRDWGAYTRELDKLQADKRITNRLNEIRQLERNPYTHPEINVEPDKAAIVFELCTGVVHLMAEAVGKQNP